MLHKSTSLSGNHKKQLWILEKAFALAPQKEDICLAFIEKLIETGDNGKAEHLLKVPGETILLFI